MHNYISIADKSVHQLLVAYVASNKLDLVEYGFEISAVACIGELVDHRHLVLGVMREGVVHKVCPNEPRPTCNQ